MLIALPPAAHEEEARCAPPSADAALEGAPSFAPLYQQYFDFVWRSARRLGVGEEAIEDLVQEVFVIVHRQLPGFEGRSTLRTWLYGIVLRVVREHRRTTHRADARRGTAGDDAYEKVADGGRLPDERCALVQAVHVLERVLDEMPAEQRDVFVMAELEGMTVPEIAALAGTKVNTIYSRLRLAREQFELSALRYRTRDGWRVA
jgi:RNA polymerase sigma-70 factor (ECF subfamily)